MSETSGREEDEDPIDEAFAAFLRSCDVGQNVSREAFLGQFPEIASELRDLMNTADLFQNFVARHGTDSEADGEEESDDFDGNDAKPVKTLPGLSSADGQSSEPIEDGDHAPNHRSPLLSSSDPQTPVSRSPSDPPSTISVASSSIPNLAAPDSRNSPTLGARDNNETLDGTETGENKANPPIESGLQLPFQLGKYRLDQMLGCGGMGIVYLATQEGLNRQVAVKLIRSGTFAGEAEVRRFRTEAQAAAKLKNPNIVTVHDFGFHEGHHYFSMDYVDGIDLSRKLDEGPLPPRIAARYVRDCALAIHYAHQNGILHRDLKPANVLIDQHDHVRLTDFGLAKQIDSENSLTGSGTAIGTPSYMAPEQIQSEGRRIDARADVYALGAVLFALLTGRPPFSGETAVQTFLQVIHRPAPHLDEVSRDLPEDLDTIIQKCLDKEPDNRYRSARELADDIERFLEGRPLNAKPRNYLQRQWNWFRDVPIVAALTGRKVLDTTPTHHRFQAFMLIAILLVPALLFSLFAVDRWNRSRMPNYVRIAGGVDDGLYNRLAEEIALRITRSHQVDATVIASEGSLTNRDKLLGGEVELAPLQGSTIRDESLGVIAPLYFEAIHALVRRDARIRSIGDLRGKRVAVGPEGSGSRMAVEMLFDAYGLDAENPERIHSPWSNLDELEGIDAIVLCIGTGSDLVERLLSGGEFDILSIAEAIDVAEKHPALRPLRIARNDYPDHAIPNEGLATVGMPSFLTTPMDASNVLVRAALDAIYAEPKLSPNLIPKQIAREFESMQMHPEARRYFGY